MPKTFCTLPTILPYYYCTLHKTLPTSYFTLPRTLPTSYSTLPRTLPTSYSTLPRTLPTSYCTLPTTLPTSYTTLPPTLPRYKELYAEFLGNEDQTHVACSLFGEGRHWYYDFIISPTQCYSPSLSHIYLFYSSMFKCTPMSSIT